MSSKIRSMPETCAPRPQPHLRGQSGSRVDRVPGVEALQKELGELIMRARIPCAGQPRSETDEGDGYVIGAPRRPRPSSAP